MKRLKSVEQIAMVPYLARWLLLSSVLGALAGFASALFLFALDRATNTRQDLRFERISQVHYAFKTLAYTIINLRHYCRN